MGRLTTNPLLDIHGPYPPDMRIIQPYSFAGGGGGGYTPGWQTAVAISTVGDGIVETTGTLVEAVNLGDSTDRTVNGVVFDGQTTRNTFVSFFSNASIYQDGVIGSDFENMMDAFVYDGTTISLTGLTNGQTYLLQILCSDDRGGGINNRTQTYSIAGHTSGALRNGDSYAVVCIFEATGTTQTLTITSSAGSVNLNGFQVRLLP